jgi:hypothetical protein
VFLFFMATGSRTSRLGKSQAKAKAKIKPSQAKATGLSHSLGSQILEAIPELLELL